MNPASILNQLKAESLLEDSHILTQIDTLRNGLRYKTDGEEVSFDDFFQTLQSEIGALPRIELESSISPGAESEYQIQLVTALERVFDDADRVLNRLLFFQSKLRAAQQQFQVLEVTFIAWYSIAATEFLNAPDFKAIKLNGTAIKALAQSEFGRLMEGVNIDVEALVEVTKVLSKQLLSHKTVAQEKYNLGKDQVNASWTSNNLPPEGIAGGEEGQDLIVPTEPEPEEETVPAFVSKTPIIAPRLGPGDETIRQLEEQTEQAEEELIAIVGRKVEAITAPYRSQPNIKELEEILNSEETTPVEVLPNGEILALPGVGISQTPVEIETPADSITVTAINAAGETIPFVSEEGVVSEKLTLEVKGDEFSLLPPGVSLNATPLEEVPTPVKAESFVRGSDVIIRTKENFPDKIKCKNCHRRIRVNQLMFVADGEGNWAHAEAEDCEAGEIPKVKTIAASVEAAPEIQGTFKKYGEPMEITSIPAMETKIEQDDINNTFQPILTTEITVPIDREKIREQIASNPDLPVEAGEEISSATLLGVLEQQAAAPKPERKRITILPPDEAAV